MSTVCVLTPIVVGSWPMIASAIAGAAGSMGFAITVDDETPIYGDSKTKTKTKVETEVPHSEVLAEVMSRGEKIKIERDGVSLEFSVDDRGKCNVCVTGTGHGKAALERIGEEVAGRVVQQFAYHKLMAELKERHYDIVEESVEADASIQMRIKLNR
jgi:hypothetical protein